MKYSKNILTNEVYEIPKNLDDSSNIDTFLERNLDKNKLNNLVNFSIFSSKNLKFSILQYEFFQNAQVFSLQQFL